MPRPTVLLDGLLFPESPRWRDDRLWFSDTHDHKVIAVAANGQAETIAIVPEGPSGLGSLPDGRLLVVSQANSLVLRLDPDGTVTHADLKAAAVTVPNDMVVDRRGRAYIGDAAFHLATERFRHGSIVLVADGEVRLVADRIALANGMVITPDENTLIVAETFGMRLTAFDIGPDGSLSNRRLFADLRQTDDTPGVIPDGICLDSEGAVWVASPLAGEFLRVKEGGEIADRIRVRPKWAVACALGGNDGRTLFLCTAETTQEDFNRGKSIGWIETARVDVPGAGSP